MGAFTMGLLRLVAFLMLLGGSALAQSPTFGVGRTPTGEEIRAWDISISPTGEELPPGRGTAEEGALVYRRRGCAGCHGATGTEGRAPRLVKREAGPDVDPWDLGRILPIRAPYATVVWDYINRGMPLNREGSLTADEVYALTKLNGVIVYVAREPTSVVVNAPSAKSTQLIDTLGSTENCGLISTSPWLSVSPVLCPLKNDPYSADTRPAHRRCVPKVKPVRTLAKSYPPTGMMMSGAIENGRGRNS